MVDFAFFEPRCGFLPIPPSDRPAPAEQAGTGLRFQLGLFSEISVGAFDCLAHFRQLLLRDVAADLDQAD